MVRNVSKSIPIFFAYLRERDVPLTIKGRSQRERFEDAKPWAFKMEEEATSQEMQEAISWKIP